MNQYQSISLKEYWKIFMITVSSAKFSPRCITANYNHQFNKFTLAFFGKNLTVSRTQKKIPRLWFTDRICLREKSWCVKNKVKVFFNMWILTEESQARNKMEAAKSIILFTVVFTLTQGFPQNTPVPESIPVTTNVNANIPVVSITTTPATKVC